MIMAPNVAECAYHLSTQRYTRSSSAADSPQDLLIELAVIIKFDIAMGMTKGFYNTDSSSPPTPSSLY